MSSISERRAASWADLMAVFWVQQLFTLPVIYEHLGMGDELPHRRQPALLRQLSNEQLGQSSIVGRFLKSNSYHEEVSQEGRLTQLDSNTGRPQAMEVERLPSQQFAVGNMASTSSLNMGQMANALPDYRASNLGAPSFQQSIALQGDPRMYQYQTSPQFAGQSRTQHDQTFNQQYPIQLQQQRPSPPNYSQAQGFAVSHGQNQQQFSSYYGHPQPSPQGYAQYAQGPQGFPGGQSAYNPGYIQRISPSQLGGQMRQDSAYYYSQGTMPTGQYIQTSGPGLFALCSSVPKPHTILTRSDLSRQSSDSSMRPSAPRGPPRKPKQSGHALWVGNLPPGTHVADLKDHFSRDATKDIESVFLISKSNCAFVNYKTDSACSAAMARFHDSRFKGVRLVCRLRRGSAATSSGTPVGPSSGVRDPEASEQEEATARTTETAVQDSELEQYESSGPQAQSTEKVTEKFFVVKSLTVEDLDLSVRNGIWATQAHNEAGLNKAYEVSLSFQCFSMMITDIYFTDRRERVPDILRKQVRRVLRLRSYVFCYQRKCCSWHRSAGTSRDLCSKSWRHAEHYSHPCD